MTDTRTDVTEAELRRARPKELTVEKSLVYRVSRTFWRFWFTLVHRYRVEGREHLPREGGCVIVANHQSFLDIPLIAASTPRHVCFVARDTLAKSRVVGFMIKHTGAVMVRRGATDRAALREMVEHLKLGDAVAIYPEGTRSRDGRVREFQRGTAVIARQAKVPLVPCGIRGTGDVAPMGALLPRPRRCAIRYGPPIDSADGDALERAREAVRAMVGDGSFASVPPVP